MEDNEEDVDVDKEKEKNPNNVVLIIILGKLNTKLHFAEIEAFVA